MGPNPLDRVSPQNRTKAAAILAKWDAFAPKVETRVGEVVAEAEQGIADLIAGHPLDAQTMGTAFQAVHQRFVGLGQKVEEAFGKIGREFDELLEGDFPDDERIALLEVEASLHERRRALRDRIEHAKEAIETKKNADWARALFASVEAERGVTVPCGHCGAPLTNPTPWQSANVTCAACRAVTTAYPGVATGLYFQGNGVHALAVEAARSERLAELAAERAYKGRRVPTTTDRDAYLRAAAAYWTKYYEVVRSLHPGFDGDVKAAVQGKMLHFSQWETQPERDARAKAQTIVDVSASGRHAELRATVKSLGVDLDDAIHTLFEHGDAKGTETLLGAKYVEDHESDPKGPWIRHEFARLSREFRLRAT